MKYCSQCRNFFAEETQNCPRDNFVLEEIDIKDLVGKELDTKYCIESLLGVGGMGAVFKAHHKFIGNEVAIKIIPPEKAMDKNIAARFLREARAAATIDHVNAIRVSDFGKVGDMPYLVMEFIQGESMKEYLERKKRLELSETVHIINQVAAALDVAHSFRIVHRDLKPDNIMFKTGLRGERVVKVVDFGIAKIKIPSDKGNTPITGPGTIIGTARYMSPEQCQAAPIDHRSDIYSLGVIVYEALTGQCPYGDASGMQAIIKHITETPPKPRSLNPDIPEPVEKVILKALAKQSADRYATAGEFATELTVAAEAFCDLKEVVQSPVISQSTSPIASQLANNQTIESPIQAIPVAEGNQTVISTPSSSVPAQSKQTVINSNPEDIIYMAKEYVGGHTLAKELEKRGRFSPIEALEILEPIGSVLQLVQRANYSSLQPFNIILKEISPGKYQGKLLDLGLATRLIGSNAGQNLGASYYIPPEQRESKSEINEQTDIYSFGIIFYELVSGQILQNLDYQHASPPSLNELDKNISKKFSDVIAKATSKNKEDRQQNIEQLFIELRKAVFPHLSVDDKVLEEKKVDMLTLDPPNINELKSSLSNTKIIIKHISGSKSGQIEEFPLEKYQEITFGRDQSSNVLYHSHKESRVGRHQAKIIVGKTSLEFYIVDNKTLNGTYLNNQKLTNLTKIKPGNVIKFGKKGPEFIFDLDPRPILLREENTDSSQFRTLPETAITPSTKHLSGLTVKEHLIIKHLKGSKMGQINSFLTKDLCEITIGRAPTSVIRFNSDRDYLVSNRHAKIRLETGTPTKFILVDLNSSNGTYLNDQKVTNQIPIKPGDKIRLGLTGPEFEIMLT